MIGYGNGLRGDDAVGLHVAEAIHELGLRGVEVRSLHQLTPELAVEIGQYDLVVFVDADVEASAVQACPVVPDDGPVRTTHHLRPSVLLALAAALGERVPDAIAVGVPARELGLSTTLSPAAVSHVREAVAQVVSVIRSGPPRST